MEAGVCFEPLKISVLFHCVTRRLFFRYQQKYQQIFHAWLFLSPFGFCQYHNSLMLPCKGGLNLRPPLAKPRLKPKTEHRGRGEALRDAAWRVSAVETEHKLNTCRTHFTQQQTQQGSRRRPHNHGKRRPCGWGNATANATGKGQFGCALWGISIRGGLP